MLRTIPGAKLGAALAAGAVSFGAIGAAAYTGILPSGLQNLAHTTVGAPAADQGKAADKDKAATHPTGKPSSHPTGKPSSPFSHPSSSAGTSHRS